MSNCKKAVKIIYFLKQTRQYSSQFVVLMALVGYLGKNNL